MISNYPPLLIYPFKIQNLFTEPGDQNSDDLLSIPFSTKISSNNFESGSGNEKRTLHIGTRHLSYLFGVKGKGVK